MSDRARRLPPRRLLACARRGLLMLLMLQPGVTLAAETTITAAEYAEPTSEYPHGVLGDDQEWRQLLITVKRQSGQKGGLFHLHLDLTYRIAARPDSVFEDIAPRLWDVTGDGAPEVVVVESHQSLGARLLIIGLVGDKPEYLAATPHIGQRFRWLAPVGAADLDGDGRIEIAYVDRPHLARTLRIWRYVGGNLIPVTDQSGLTNHRIGEPYISGGIRACTGHPEIVTANANWTRLIVSTLQNDRIETVDIGPYTDPTSFSAALACR